MGCGVPTILSRISSYTSFDQPQDYALFADVNDSEGLADAIAEMYHNAALRTRIIDRGLAAAELFTKQKVMQRFVSALESIVGRNAVLKYKK
jgi:glycosyltransferase involved in cell wall biosynthesis